MSTLETHVDVEDIQTTKSEKLLAVVLAAFLLVGGLWAYQKVDDSVRAAVPPATGSAADRAAVERRETAHVLVQREEQDELQALGEMEVAREAYRTALDAGRPAAALERAYEDAEARYEQAKADLAAARLEADRAGPAAEAAERRILADGEHAARVESLAVFGVRLGLVLAALVGAYALLGHLRTRGSRYLPLVLAACGSAAVVALVMAGDYVTDYVDPLEFGPLVLAVAGAGLTLAAFVGLQRYLQRRMPVRRVRKGECPFCGFPGRAGTHCEGCGHALVADCAICGGARRVGAQHCGACGAT